MKTSDSKYYKCLYFSSNALARKMEKLAQQSWAAVDLSPSHAYLLMIVLEGYGVQPSTLAGQLQLQPSTVTRLIEKLEEKKLVVRIAEGKTTNVYPTSKAKELFPKMKDCVADYHLRCAELISRDDSHKLVSMMGKLSDKVNL
jgi:DNA-binding MarR family transcriptional regulator